jgi:hypothetical protein
VLQEQLMQLSPQGECSFEEPAEAQAMHTNDSNSPRADPTLRIMHGAREFPTSFACSRDQYKPNPPGG